MVSVKKCAVVCVSLAYGEEAATETASRSVTPGGAAFMMTSASALRVKRSKTFRLGLCRSFNQLPTVTKTGFPHM